MPRIAVNTNVADDKDVLIATTIKSNNIPRNSFILFVFNCIRVRYDISSD
jgi:hypothetical protein